MEYHFSPIQISRTPSFKHKPLIDLNVSPKEDCLSPDPIESTKSSVYRPEWLPVDWDYTSKVRTSGASAGTADKYFISPSGQRFRSKVEVLHYLETGSKRKMGKKAKSDSDAPPSESPTDKKKKKAKSNARDFSDLKFDFKNPPRRVTWVRGDDSTDDWVPTAGDATIPVAVKKEWARVYSRVTHLDATISPGSP